MIRNSDERPPSEIIISNEMYEKIISKTKEGVLKKLKAATQLLDIDLEISAGLYTYAIEEFGKLLVLKRSISTKNGARKILYRSEFTNHNHKFTVAFDYLSEHRIFECMIINTGDFSIQNFHWKNFHVGLLADFESRLSIFYSDFERQNNEEADYKITEIKQIDRDLLEKATVKLVDVINNNLT
jgi:hypothetical protein